jgi:signal transduction histidine kinase
VSIERVVAGQINAQVKERCESDSRWFLTGPLEGRPPNGIFIERTPDDLPPRPKVPPQPYELFAYDELFLGSSFGAPRFPEEIRRALRASSQPAHSTYTGDFGTGAQVGIPTGWIGSPCMYFLGRLAPSPDQRRELVVTAGASYGVALIAILLGAAGTVHRVRRLARDARESVNEGYTTIAPDALRDELSSVAFAWNTAAKELQLRLARTTDQDEALRRLIRSTQDDVVQPLASLEQALAVSGTSRESVLQQAHDLSARVGNVLATGRLRQATGLGEPVPVDLGAVVEQAIDRHRGVAAVTGVTLSASLPDGAVTVAGDAALLERAISNVIDNAVRYNVPDGSVRVDLSRDATDRTFRLSVVDRGPGIPEEDFRTLAVARRFRGDESTNRRPGARGLGLSVAQEVADRFGMTMELRRPQTGGVEVVFTGKLR